MLNPEFETLDAEQSQRACKCIGLIMLAVVKVFRATEAAAEEGKLKADATEILAHTEKEHKQILAHIKDILKTHATEEDILMLASNRLFERFVIPITSAYLKATMQQQNVAFLADIERRGNEEVEKASQPPQQQAFSA